MTKRYYTIKHKYNLSLTLFKMSTSDSLSYNKYKYFNVSAKKKDSKLSFGIALGTPTFLYSPYAIDVLQYFSIDWKISLWNWNYVCTTPNEDKYPIWGLWYEQRYCIAQTFLHLPTPFTIYWVSSEFMQNVEAFNCFWPHKVIYTSWGTLNITWNIYLLWRKTSFRMCIPEKKWWIRISVLFHTCICIVNHWLVSNNTHIW